MRTTKDSSKNTTRLWGKPKWRGKELSAGTFFVLGLGLLTVVLAAGYYFFKL